MSTAHPSTDIVAAWPMISRPGLAGAVQAGLNQSGAVLVGLPGCGSSTLARHVVSSPTLHVAASPESAAIDRWLTLVIDGDEDLSPAGVGAALRARHRGAGTPLLVIDDLDLLDLWSASTVLHLVANRELRIVATRSSLEPPSPVVSALWREGGVLRLEVPPLDDAECMAVMRAALGGPIDGRAAGELVTLSSGNPLILRELVEGGRTSGALAQRDGLWYLREAPPLSGLLRERADATLSTLDEPARAALELLTYAGPVPAAVAGRLVDAGVLERLERRGFLAVFGEPDDLTVSVCGALVTTVVERTLPVLTRRRLAADLVAATDPPDEVARLDLRRAVWQLDSGRHVDADRLLSSSRRAIDAGDPLLAERLARSAGAGGAGTEAVLLESWCAAERGDGERAAEVLAAHRPTGDEAAMAIAIRQAEEQFWGQRDAQAAGAILQAAANTASVPWPSAATAQQCVFDILDGHVEEAIRTGTPLIAESAQLIGSTAALGVGVALAMADRAAEGEAVALAAMARSSDADLYIDPGVHIISLAHALIGLGRLDEADALTNDVYQYALSRPGRQAQGWSALMRAQVAVAVGRPSQGADAAREAELIWSGAHLQGLARWSATMAALAHAEEGDLVALGAAIARAEGYEAVPFRLFEPDLERARAWAASLAGRADSVPCFVAVAEACIRSGRCSIAASAAHDLIRIGRPSEASKVLAALGTHGPVTEARRQLAGAVETRDDGALLEVADGFEAMGARGWAAEALAFTSRRAGDAPSAAHRRAVALAEGTGLATPPINRLPAPDARARLTAREAEVSHLVAAGLSNREVAERLVVSLRTVENHLHRAFAKLGVASRSDLHDVLAGLGPI